MFFGWTAAQKNIDTVARLAFALGCEGLFIDPEESGVTGGAAFDYYQMIDYLTTPTTDLYGLQTFIDSGLTCPQDKADANKNDSKWWPVGRPIPDGVIAANKAAFDKNRQVVKARASRLMEIIHTYLPNAVILLTEGYSGFVDFKLGSNDMKIFESPSVALLPAFVDGLIEFAESHPSLSIVDGCEKNYDILDASDSDLYAKTNSLVDAVVGVNPADGGMPLLKSLSLDWDKYKKNIKIGFGLNFQSLNVPLARRKFQVAFDIIEKLADPTNADTDHGVHASPYIWCWFESKVPWTIDPAEVSSFRWYRWQSLYKANISTPSFPLQPYSVEEMFSSFSSSCSLAILDVIGTEKDTFMKEFCQQKTLRVSLQATTAGVNLYFLSTAQWHRLGISADACMFTVLSSIITRCSTLRPISTVRL